MIIHDIPRLNRVSNLIITDSHIAGAIDSHASGLLEMRAVDFLYLTTNPQFDFSDINEFMEKALSVEQYNAFQVGGNRGPMPALKVAVENGRVETHEGRHRSAAIIRENGTDGKLWVAIRVCFDGYSRRVQQNEIPSVFYGEMVKSRRLVITPNSRFIHYSDLMKYYD